MQLMNIRYKCVADFTQEEFPMMMVDWVRNTNDLRYRMNFEEIPFTGYQKYTDGKKELTIIEYREMHTIAALHTDTDALGVSWTLSVVFKPLEHLIYIRMTNSRTTEDGRFMAKFRKPDLIDELVDLQLLDMDYDVPMQYQPHTVSKGKTAEFLKILKRESRFTLPVIYISIGPYSMYGIDPDKTAGIYAGLAHVYEQGDKECFGEMIANTDRYVPKHGEVVILYPNDRMADQHLPFNNYDEKEMEKSIAKAINYFYHNQSYGPLTTYEEIASRAIALRNNSLREENREVYLEKERVERENTELVNTFDTDLKKSDAEMDKLKKRLQELERENRILRTRVEASEERPLLYYGKEKELYTGEIKELLLDILKNNVSVSENSRRADILKDILQANSLPPSVKEQHSRIRKALEDYREMTPDVRTALEKAGFRITSDGKHHKLYYRNDPRYYTVLPKTSSDHRAGMNAATEIIQKMM